MLFIQCKGTELFTHGLWNIGNDISYGLKCIFYNIFKKTLKQDDENSHNVCAIQCRIAINVVDLVEFYGRLCLLFYWISFTVQLERTLES